MKYALDISTAGEYSNPRLLAELAAEAEQAGWDGFFVWDIVYAENRPEMPVIDPQITLAAIAMNTQRIKIGALLTPLPRRHPWEAARQAVTLDLLSNGRLIFGAGLGYQALDFLPFGENFDVKNRAERLDEALEVVAGLWAGSTFRYQGVHYQVDVPGFLPKPLQLPRIPVWLGGYWPNRKPLRRATKWDGFFIGSEKADGESLTLQDFKDAVAYITSVRGTLESFDLAVPGITPSDAKKGASIVQPYIDAGATWWVEAINQWVGPLEDMRTRIRSGPPRL